MGTAIAALGKTQENLMATSPLLGGQRAAKRPEGTGTDALGPSDSSDTGSDIQGAPGAVETDDGGFDTGTLDDTRRAAGAGADIGDANLDADSDRFGTGERAEAGRDTLTRDAPDIAPDRVEGTGDVPDIEDIGMDEESEEPEGDIEGGGRRGVKR
jgi:hypothetical protein